MGGGVAGAIKRKGGQDIEKEAVHKGPIPVGDATITGAGKLSAKYIIHAATMGQDFKTDPDKIRSAMHSAMKCAEDHGISSIAVPALGAGVGGFEIHQVANILINEAIEFLQKAKKLKEIRFVLFDSSTFQVFKETLGGIFSR
jgi:O-acetyl-ADP-ribose deacetylase (regulator of RNase III)